MLRASMNEASPPRKRRFGGRGGSFAGSVGLMTGSVARETGCRPLLTGAPARAVASQRAALQHEIARPLHAEAQVHLLRGAVLVLDVQPQADHLRVGRGRG